MPCICALVEGRSYLSFLTDILRRGLTIKPGTAYLTSLASHLVAEMSLSPTFWDFRWAIMSTWRLREFRESELWPSHLHGKCFIPDPFPRSVGPKATFNMIPCTHLHTCVPIHTGTCSIGIPGWPSTSSIVRFLSSQFSIPSLQESWDYRGVPAAQARRSLQGYFF